MVIRNFQRDKVPFIKTFESFGSKIDFTSWKKNSPNSKLDLEVGCGVGLHPLRYSLENKDRHLIALEHTQIKFEKLKGRFIGNGEPANLWGIHANAISFITHQIPDKCIDRYFFLYPNPEPQNRQKRWLQMPFFSEVVRTLNNSGEVILTTNELSYMEEAREKASAIWNLKEIDFLIIRQGDRRPLTHFEKKYLERGQRCYEARWTI